ncbi:hypothetical protein [Micromonospora parastrephiae]|uniref:hypothetical protein n=1 Tax=Micromonospora parastrephiae TaxID=2806101 RepID=UPI001EE4770A|nr:hypothetical protein [Micromonospora parastrephiae]
MELQPGREALVRVAVATLWTSPEAVRPVDGPALSVGADIPAWISGMDTDQQVGDCVLSQLLLGERVLVSELRPDGWARVVAVEQPAAKLDPRGYPGWLPADQLAPVDPAVAGDPLMVDATVTALRAAPDGPVVVSGVVVGPASSPAGPGPRWLAAGARPRSGALRSGCPTASWPRRRPSRRAPSGCSPWRSGCCT